MSTPRNITIAEQIVPVLPMDSPDPKVTFFNYLYEPTNNLMKVFKIYCGQMIYVYAAETKELAIAQFTEDTGDLFTNCEEIPENEWDAKNINSSNESELDDDSSYKLSIREYIKGNNPQMISTNNYGMF
jgi:hypothetical protein